MRILKLLLCIFYFVSASGRNIETDNLRRRLAQTVDEIKRIYILEGLSYAYFSTSPDTALLYGSEGLELAKEITIPGGWHFATMHLEMCVSRLGS